MSPKSRFLNGLEGAALEPTMGQKVEVDGEWYKRWWSETRRKKTWEVTLSSVCYLAPANVLQQILSNVLASGEKRTETKTNFDVQAWGPE
jgi:hypothetical protein